MPLPDFLVIGAAKCGTTHLCGLLSQHPDVFMHPKKELNFFARDELYEKGIDWYRRRFEAAAGRKAIGEGSPNYTKRVKHPRAADRIRQHLPDARLIYIVRHPLRRIESAWLHSLRTGDRSAGPFDRVLRKFPHFVDTSDYWTQIRHYRERFPDDRILVLFFEDFLADTQGTVSRVFRFLGVDPSFRCDPKASRTNPSLGRLVDGPMLRRLRRVRAYRSLEKRAPGLFSALTRPLRYELRERPRWDESLRRFVRERIEDNSRRFLAEHGKPEDFWDFDQ